MVVLVLSPIVALAQVPTTQPEITPQVESAVARGLAFLDRQQNDTGAFSAGDLRYALTGLSLMSYLSAGDTPDVGAYGATVRRAIDCLTSLAPANGYYGSLDGSRMYGHSIITLALAEAYGVETDDASRAKIRDALVKAVGVIVSAQNVTKPAPFPGGWRYEPTSADSDLSLSGWNALALRAARSAGIPVPDDCAPRATGFVLKCWNPTDGGFSYQPGAPATPGMTGVGALCLQLLKASDRPELAPAAKFLAAHRVTPEQRFAYYAYYYTTQAAFQAGGATWTTVWTSAEQQLPPLQQPDGGWPTSATPEEVSRIYTTSMAILTLTVPYRVLPAYQR